MCGSDTFNLRSALGIADEVRSEIEALNEDGAGPVVTGMAVNVPARTIGLGVATAEHLREAHRRVRVEATDLIGDVSRPLARGFIHRHGWTIDVYGPAGLTVIR